LVNKDESIPKASDGETVAKSYTNINRVKIFIPSPLKGFTPITFGHGGKETKRWREFTTVNPYAIPTDLEEMIVITKLSASHRVVEFLGCPVGLFVAELSSIAWMHQRQHHPFMMDQSNTIIL
jgi:hypothetical protein